MRDSIVLQRGYLWHTQLQRVVAKHIGYSGIELYLFPMQQCLALWRFEPILQIYNGIRHGFDRLARIC